MGTGAGVAVAETPDYTDEPKAGEPEMNDAIEPVFDSDKFLLRQKALAIREKYYLQD